MTTSNEAEAKKPLTLSRGKLELRKTVDAGQVKQTFPHGRSKTVAVEVKRKRTYAPGAGGKMTEVATDKELALAATELSRRGPRPSLQPDRGRARDAPEGAGRGPARRRDSPPAGGRGGAPAGRGGGRQAAAEEEARRQAAAARGEVYPPVPEPAAARLVTEEPVVAAKPKGEPAVKRIEPNVVRTARGPVAEPEEEEEARARSSAAASGRRPSRWRRAATSRAGAPARSPSSRRSTRTPGSACARWPPSSGRGRRRRRAHLLQTENQRVIRDVIIPESITVQELASPHGRAQHRRHQVADEDGHHGDDQRAARPDTAELIVTEFGHRLKRVSESDIELGLEGEDDDPASLRAAARRWSPSWAMSITARPRCSMRCARPMSRRMRPAASPSISAPIR